MMLWIACKQLDVSSRRAFMNLVFCLLINPKIYIAKYSKNVISEFKANKKTAKPCILYYVYIERDEKDICDQMPTTNLIFYWEMK